MGGSHGRSKPRSALHSLGELQVQRLSSATRPLWPLILRTGEEKPEADPAGTSGGRSPLGLWAKGFEVQTVRRFRPHEGRHGPERKSRNTSEGGSLRPAAEDGGNLSIRQAGAASPGGSKCPWEETGATSPRPPAEFRGDPCGGRCSGSQGGSRAEIRGGLKPGGD